jgi:NADP-dependent 3-hydroxy acid dehydrogenase YdfG
VGNAADCEAAVSSAVEAFGGLDVLVNAAGIWVEEPLHEASYEQIRAFVDTDVSGALQITRAALPELMKDGGRIVHINGLQGLIRVRPPVLYATVESAVRGLCESLRWEAAPHGVHVGFITLGSVANEEAPSPDPAPLHEDGKRYRLSRDEVADAVLFMLSRPIGVNVDELVLTPLGQKV